MADRDLSPRPPDGSALSNLRESTSLQLSMDIITSAKSDGDIHPESTKALVSPSSPMHSMKRGKSADHRSKSKSKRTNKKRAKTPSPHSLRKMQYKKGGPNNRASYLPVSQSMKDLMNIKKNKDFIKRKDIYLKFNKFLRQNRLSDAKQLCTQILKLVAGRSKIEWVILQGPALRNAENINTIHTVAQYKYVQSISNESEACWIDVTLLECKLKLFYEYQDGDNDDVKEGGNQLLSECISKYQMILQSLNRSIETQNPKLREYSFYFRNIESECYSCLAYAIVKSTANGFAAHSGIALQFCRKATALNPFHAMSFAIYAYLLDMCLDRYEESRDYLGYAIHLNEYYDRKEPPNDSKNKNNNDNDNDGGGRDAKSPKSTKSPKNPKHQRNDHKFAIMYIWYGMLLYNFEGEFREIEFNQEKKLRQKFKKKYKKLNKINKKENAKMLIKQKLKSFESDYSSDGDRSGRGTPQGVSSIVNDNNARLSIKGWSRAKRMTAQAIQLEEEFKKQMGRGNVSDDIYPETSVTNTNTDRDGYPTHTPLLPSDVSSQNFTQTELFAHHSASGSQIIEELVDTGSGIDIGGGGVGGSSITNAKLENIASGVSITFVSRSVSNANSIKGGGTAFDRFGKEFVENMSELSDKPEIHLEFALKLEPKNSAIHGVYGMYLIANEDYANAKMSFEKAIRYNSGNVSALNNLAFILSMPQFSQFEDARTYYKKALRLRPKSGAIHFNLARLLCHAFGREELKDSQKHYFAAITFASSNCHIHYFFALYWKFFKNNKEKYLKHIKKSNEYMELNGVRSFDVDAYCKHAEILMNEQQYKPAKFLLKRVFEMEESRKKQLKMKDLMAQIKEGEKHMKMILLQRKSSYNNSNKNMKNNNDDNAYSNDEVNKKREHKNARKRKSSAA